MHLHRQVASRIHSLLLLFLALSLKFHVGDGVGGHIRNSSPMALQLAESGRWFSFELRSKGGLDQARPSHWLDYCHLPYECHKAFTGQVALQLPGEHRAAEQALLPSRPRLPASVADSGGSPPFLFLLPSAGFLIIIASFPSFPLPEKQFEANETERLFATSTSGPLKMKIKFILDFPFSSSTKPAMWFVGDMAGAGLERGCQIRSRNGTGRAQQQDTPNEDGRFRPECRHGFVLFFAFPGDTLGRECEFSAFVLLERKRVKEATKMKLSRKRVNHLDYRKVVGTDKMDHGLSLFSRFFSCKMELNASFIGILLALNREEYQL